MLSVAALILAASASGAVDSIFLDPFEGTDIDGCPFGSPSRASFSNIFYPSGDGGSNPSNPPLRHNVDLSLFENIWGHFTSTDATVYWPGTAGALPVLRAFGRNQYLAAKFHVPANVSLSLAGQFQHASYYGGPPLTMSISQTCADFEPENAACQITNAESGRLMINWKTIEQASRCLLAPGTDYFVNIKLSDPTDYDPNCNRSSCYIGVLNLHN